MNDDKPYLTIRLYDDSSWAEPFVRAHVTLADGTEIVYKHSTSQRGAIKGALRRLARYNKAHKGVVRP